MAEWVRGRGLGDWGTERLRRGGEGVGGVELSEMSSGRVETTVRVGRRGGDSD